MDLIGCGPVSASVVVIGSARTARAPARVGERYARAALSCVALDWAVCEAPRFFLTRFGAERMDLSRTHTHTTEYFTFCWYAMNTPLETSRPSPMRKHLEFL